MEKKNKHLLKLLDWSPEEIRETLDLADRLKAEQKAGIPHPILKDKTLGMIFQKSSTRTRVSFEVGIAQLGGRGLFLSSRDLQIGRGEPIQDTARVLSRYLDGIMIRTFAQQEVEDLARFGSIPIINGLTDFCHPCQVLADLQTCREYLGELTGKKLCFIGDGFNMANSLTVGALKMGMHVAIATPKDHPMDETVLAFAKPYGGRFVWTHSPMEAAEGADAVFTDVWASMGQEAEQGARERAFSGFTVDDALMKKANPSAIVQHCLPAHRGEEITEEMFEAHANEIFDEAENRLHAQKAVMARLMA